ncbi:hypothetical protein YC2023_075956 [Brassica napus]
MMIMVVSFSKVSFFLSSLKLNQSVRLTLRLEHRLFVVRCEASSNGREKAGYEVVLVCFRHAFERSAIKSVGPTITGDVKKYLI